MGFKHIYQDPTGECNNKPIGLLVPIVKQGYIYVPISLLPLLPLETEPIRSLRNEELEDIMILRYCSQEREERRTEIPRDLRATLRYQRFMSLQSYRNQPERHHLTVQRLEGRLAQLWQVAIDLLVEVEVDEEEFGEVMG